MPKFEHELAFGHAGTFPSLWPQTVEGLGFDCISTSLDVWTLRNSSQSDPFLTGISQSVLVQKEERFHQHPVVKADSAMCGKVREGFTPLFICPILVWKHQMLLLISVAHLRIWFLPTVMRSNALLCSSPWGVRGFFFLLVLPSAVVCSVILRSFRTCSEWLLQWSDCLAVEDSHASAQSTKSQIGAVLQWQLIGSYFLFSTVNRYYYCFSWKNT